MIKKNTLITVVAFSLASIFFANNAVSSSQMNMAGDGKKMHDCMKMMSKGLGPKDAQYDERFIDMMIPHHEGAIMMSKDALKNANKPELKQLAQNIIDAQEKEIALMKQWRKEWYGH